MRQVPELRALVGWAMAVTRASMSEDGAASVPPSLQALLDALAVPSLDLRAVETLAVRAASEAVAAQASWLFPRARSAASPLPLVGFSEGDEEAPGATVVAALVREYASTEPREHALAGGTLWLLRAGEDVLALWRPPGPPRALPEALLAGILATLESFRSLSRAHAALTRARLLGEFSSACLAAQPSPPDRRAMELLRRAASFEAVALLRPLPGQRALEWLAVSDGAARIAQSFPFLLPIPGGSGLAAAHADEAWMGPMEGLGLPLADLPSDDAGPLLANAIPLRGASGLVGILATVRRSAVLPLAADELQRVTTDLSSALVAASEADANRQHTLDLTAVAAVGRAAFSSLDPDTLLHDALRALHAGLNADWTRLFLRDGDRLRLVAGHGVPEGRLPAPTSVPVGDPLARSAMQASEPLDLDPTSLGRVGRSPLALPGAGRLLVFGLHPPAAHPPDQATSPPGFVIAGRRDGRPFGRAERTLLAEALAPVGQALRNARAFDELRRRTEDLALVREVALLPTAGPERTTRLDALARHLAAIAGVSGAALLASHGLRLMVAGLSTGRPRPAPIDPADAGLVGRALLLRELVEDRTEGAGAPALMEALFGWVAATSLALPLPVPGRHLGVLLLADPDPEFVLSEPDRARLLALVAQVAGALDHERLARELEASHLKLRDGQEALIRRERLAALGDAAAAVAHEIRTPLGAIYSSLGQLEKGVEMSPVGRRHYGIIREEVQLLARVVHDLLDVARPMRLSVRTQPLRPAVEQAVATAEASETARRAGRFSTVTVVEVDPRLPPLPFDDPMLRQALMNLCVNAYQATGHAGHVRVVAGAALGEAGKVARIAVIDDGPGVPEALREAIFEPFRTTKASGSGLGLAMVKRIVDRHGGTVHCEAAPGGGARFVVDLPLAGPPDLSDPAGAPS